MEFSTVLLLIVVMIAIVVGIIITLKNAFDFYRRKFQFSIWTSVFLLLFLVILSESTSAQSFRHIYCRDNISNLCCHYDLQ